MIRKKLGYKYLFDSLYNKLDGRMFNRSTSHNEPKNSSERSVMKYLTDATNFDLLYQSEYSNKFGYVSAAKRSNKQ